MLTNQFRNELEIKHLFESVWPISLLSSDYKILFVTVSSMFGFPAQYCFGRLRGNEMNKNNTQTQQSSSLSDWTTWAFRGIFLHTHCTTFKLNKATITIIITFLQPRRHQSSAYFCE